MNIILLFSILLRLISTSWSFILLIKIRDWRMFCLTFMLFMMFVRQTLTFAFMTEKVYPSLNFPNNFDELPGLFVSILIFLFVYFFADLLCNSQKIHQNLELKYHEIENHNQALMNVLPDLLIKISKDGIFLDCTDNHDDLAMNINEFIGKNIANIMPSPIAELTMLHVKRSLAQKQLEIFEYQITIPMGSNNIQDYEARIVPCEKDKVFAIIRNITQRKKLEYDLVKAKNRSDKTSKAKGDFLATMSHEIRTPMNAVIGVAELLDKTNLNSTQKKYVKMLSDSGKHLLYLVNDILDLSKIEAGKFELQEENFNLKKCIEEITSIFEVSARKKNINLINQVTKENDIYIFGDCKRIQQVLSNLINNAVKFTKTGHIFAGVETKIHQDDTVDLRFFVKDTGIGMPQDKIPLLFDSFFQLDSSSTRQYAGTGLGLAICKRIVDLMGGEISVTSKENEGSTFYFTLKTSLVSCCKHKERESKEDEKLFATYYPCSLLIAEDNRINQVIFKNFFCYLGYNVDIVSNGEEVIQRVEEKNYDIIFMDIHMPIVDGLQATFRIRERNSNTDSPTIVAVTADAFDDNKEHLLNNGMNDFLSKPVTLEDIKKIIRTYIQRKTK